MSEVLEASGEAPQPFSIEKPPAFVPRPSRAELIVRGEALRKLCPRSCHADWKAPPDRPDPLRLVEESGVGRLPRLVPLRHGRMLQSPFTFYRGAALNMAADLAGTPDHRPCACRRAATAIVQLRLLCHAGTASDLRHQRPGRDPPRPVGVGRQTPGRQLRARLPQQRLQRPVRPRCGPACVRSYREHMAEFSTMRVLDVWYARFEAEGLIANIEDGTARKRHRKGLAKARGRQRAGGHFSRSWRTRRATRRPSRTTRR